MSRKVATWATWGLNFEVVTCQFCTCNQGNQTKAKKGKGNFKWSFERFELENLCLKCRIVWPELENIRRKEKEKRKIKFLDKCLKFRCVKVEEV